VRSPISEHYGRPLVRDAILSYCRERWVAVTDGRKWLRYEEGRPLTAEGAYPMLFRGFRSVYATASVYRDLSSREILEVPENLASFTPFWDIDNEFSAWECTIQAAQILCERLRSMGIRESVYVVWSGNGAHVRVHEGAMPGRSPLDEAWALVTRILGLASPEIADLTSRCPSIKVQNLVKPHALFTAPFSLHRIHDRVAVPLCPDELEDFRPSWVEPSSFRYCESWQRFRKGEAAEAVRKALEIHGGYPVVGRRKRKTRSIEEMLRKFI